MNLLKNKLNLTHIFYIEGNIGSGKTDFLKERFASSQIEPLDLWNRLSTKEGSIFFLFYSNPSKYAGLFKIVSLLSLQSRLFNKTLKGAGVFERSIDSVKEIFEKQMFLSQNISPFEHTIFLSFFFFLKKLVSSLVREEHLFVSQDLKLCLSRIKQRKRREEAGITLSYLKELEQRKIEWAITIKNKKEFNSFLEARTYLTKWFLY